MNSTLTRMKRIEKLIKAKNSSVYIVEEHNNLYIIDGRTYTEDQFAEWLNAHDNSVIIIDDLWEET
ncbi:hypothetical protein [Massiliimalia timonensis]|uniref:hypothetical protein n=1 Tax=Massiliimalia timonensis TaxID=1987501 RepID=UPI0018A02DDC|nr:hypothetical protein [Massiliimalia timonensis]